MRVLLVLVHAWLLGNVLVLLGTPQQDEILGLPWQFTPKINFNTDIILDLEHRLHEEGTFTMCDYMMLLPPLLPVFRGGGWG